MPLVVHKLHRRSFVKLAERSYYLGTLSPFFDVVSYLVPSARMSFVLLNEYPTTLKSANLMERTIYVVIFHGYPYSQPYGIS